MEKKALTEAVTSTRRHMAFEYATNKRTEHLGHLVEAHIKEYLTRKHPKAAYRVAEIEQTTTPRMLDINEPHAEEEQPEPGIREFDIDSIVSYRLKDELNIHSAKEAAAVSRAASQMIHDFFGKEHLKPRAQWESDVESTDWGSLIVITISSNPGAIEKNVDVLTDEDMKTLTAEIRSTVAHTVGQLISGLLVTHGGEHGMKITSLKPMSNLAEYEKYPFYWFVVGLRWKSPYVVTTEKRGNVGMTHKFHKLQHTLGKNSTLYQQDINNAYASIVTELLKSAGLHDISPTDMLGRVKDNIEF